MLFFTVVFIETVSALSWYAYIIDYIIFVLGSCDSYIFKYQFSYACYEPFVPCDAEDKIALSCKENEECFYKEKLTFFSLTAG